MTVGGVLYSSQKLFERGIFCIWGTKIGFQRKRIGFGFCLGREDWRQRFAEEFWVD